MKDPKKKGERIAKRLSRSGICSRREAERWLADGRVTVDGEQISKPATLVTDQSIITVDGKRIAQPEQPKLWRYHKPRGVLSTNSDPENRPTVFDHLPKNLPRVMLVGRLDFNSEGLLLLTNDGELARSLELPSTGWIRQYRVRAYGPLDESRLVSLAGGITAPRPIRGIRVTGLSSVKKASTLSVKPKMNALTTNANNNQAILKRRFRNAP